MAFSDIDFNGVSCIHNFMRRVTSSTYLFPAAPLGSINTFFFQCTIFSYALFKSFSKLLPATKFASNEQEEWKEANNSSKINRNSTKRYQPLTSRNKFQPIYVETIDLKEDDAHTINLQINNLSIQNTQRPSPVVNKYPDRDLLHHQIKNATTFIVPGNTDFNNAVKFGRKTYILGTSMIKEIRRKEFNSKLNKCSTRFRPFIGATLKQMETYVKLVLNDDTPDVLILHTGWNDIGNKQLTENEIAEWIVKIGRQCKESNVNNVFISSLV